ncbi:MAG TPA: PEMT/PEM2 methyltransferase family protein [Blastocatellia bacterium]|nr:PEMT/PEM2 methyltransferase family protein [Blastocatellia bacterium]
MTFQLDDVALSVAIGLHLVFRLGYLYSVGVGLRVGERHCNEDPHSTYRRWLAFKKRTYVVFAGDVITTAALLVITADTMGPQVPLVYTLPTSIILIVSGILAKFAAYRVIGDKGFYYYNFFCNDEERSYVSKGIYRYLKNPMYSVGYLHAIGFPLLFRSSIGVAFGFFDWAIIWVFCLVFEHSHTSFHRARLAAASSTDGIAERSLQ